MADELQPEPPIADETTRRSASSNPSSLRAVAIRASMLFHLALAVVLASWYLPSLQSQPAVAESKRPDQAPPSEAASSTAPLPATALPAANVPDEQIKSSLTSQIQSAAEKSDQRKLKELAEVTERMQQIVKPESIDGLVESIGRSVGVDTKMYADKPPVEGTKFNPNTAQLTSVERKQGPDGSWTYEALMVDANGNRSTVPMPAAEGASAYDAFEKIKGMRWRVRCINSW